MTAADRRERLVAALGVRGLDGIFVDLGGNAFGYEKVDPTGEMGATATKLPSSSPTWST